MDVRLSTVQWDKLLEFLGYGNPGGRFWFVGIEERGMAESGQEVAELNWRLTFEPIEDLPAAHGRWGKFGSGAFDMRSFVPTWATMCKLVLRLSGNPQWEDRDALRDYQATQLGRRDGDTFLTELQPLPVRGRADWPYMALSPTRDALLERILPDRLGRLRELRETHRPVYVFCYGKTFWPRYEKEAFRDYPFHEVLNAVCRVATAGQSRIILLPFFGRGLVSNRLVDEIATLLLAGPQLDPALQPQSFYQPYYVRPGGCISYPEIALTPSHPAPILPS